MNVIPCQKHPSAPLPNAELALAIGAIPIIWDCGRLKLVCPRCGFEYVHPIGITCLPAGSTGGEVRIEKAGILWDPSASPEGRGVLIELHFACESGHLFGYQFHFHNGQTHMERLGIPVHMARDTIWRD